MGETPQQRVWRDRFETVIGLAAPALDLVLNVGERASRVIAPQGDDHYPIRPAAEAMELEPAAGPRHHPPEPAD
jgi:hypothetical protein